MKNLLVRILTLCCVGFFLTAFGNEAYCQVKGTAATTDANDSKASDLDYSNSLTTTKSAAAKVQVSSGDGKYIISVRQRGGRSFKEVESGEILPNDADSREKLLCLKQFYTNGAEVKVDVFAGCDGCGKIELRESCE